MNRAESGLVKTILREFQSSNHISKMVLSIVKIGPHFPDRIDERPDVPVLLWWQSGRFVLLLWIEAYHFAFRPAAKRSSVHLRCPSWRIGGPTWWTKTMTRTQS